MRYLLVLIVLLALCVPFVGTTAAGFAADCQFVMGFKAVHDAIPDVVGECKTDQHYNPANGDALQETANGLMVWRKSDNFTAFTDGYRSWVLGPEGLQDRLNSERFSWEKEEPKRLETSQIISDGKRDGQGELTIDNMGNSDLAGTLINTRDNSAFLTVYVRSKESITITRIPDGSYRLEYTFGDDWSSATGRFAIEKQSDRAPAIFGPGPYEAKKMRMTLGLSDWMADPNRTMPGGAAIVF